MLRTKSHILPGIEGLPTEGSTVDIDNTNISKRKTSKPNVSKLATALTWLMYMVSGDH